MSGDGRPAPLEGIRVLDIGTMIAGPVAATLLADFGAEVIKVEQPEGDPLREVGPFIAGEGLWWNVEGRNKKSVTANLRLPQGQQVVKDLVRHADVLVENFRPGTLARWGLAWDDLEAINPRLVMLSISGYGQTGPNASRAAYDRIALAFAGLIHITGFPDRPPLRPGNATADYQSALFGAFSVMMALFHRDARGGTGQHIDLALYECIFRFTDMLMTNYAAFGTVRERRGNLNFAAAPGDHFVTSDGRYIVLTVSSDAMFRRACQAMATPDLATDGRFATHDARWANIEEINGIMGRWIRSLPVDELCERLDAAGLAYALVYSIADIAADPHYAARGTIASLDHPRMGVLKMPAPQPRLSATPAAPIQPAPLLGSHTEEFLGRLLGYSRSEIDALRAAGAI